MWTSDLFKIPHMPPAGSLKVLRAPVHWGGIRHALQAKIYNLETNEFVSNLPFSKQFRTTLEGTIRVYLKLKIIFFNFKIIFQIENTLQEASFLKKHLPILNSNVGVISFFHCQCF